MDPLAGAQEHVITGAVLRSFAASWSLLATLSILCTKHPQRRAGLPAGFTGFAGAALLAFAPSDAIIDALGWVWPPLFLVVLGATVVGARRNLHSGTRLWVVYPLLGLYALAAIGGAYQTVRECSTAARIAR